MLPEKLLLIGDGEFAEIAYEYFTHDSPHEVVGFAVEPAYLRRSELFGLPVVSLADATELFPTETHSAFVAITNTQLNRVRTRLFGAVKALGYPVTRYVSSRAFVWHNVEIGANSFIFENNVLQYHVKVGENVVLWSGNHIGHRTVIHDNTFVTSHAVVSGYCEIGESCFIGVNSCFADHVVVARDCTIGMGSVVVRSTEPGLVYVGNPAKPMAKTSFETWNVPEESR